MASRWPARVIWDATSAGQASQDYLREIGAVPVLYGQDVAGRVRAAAGGRRPLTGLDVGSGTGRLTPALAQAFGPVTGVEPSTRMREIAQAQASHPGIRYLAGSAGQLPVPCGSADYALMFLSWHHVQDKPRAARELARAIRPGGRLLLRSQFSDRGPCLWWLEYVPRGFEVDASMSQPLDDVIDTFGLAGWRVADFGTVTEPSGGEICWNACACAPSPPSPASRPTSWRSASAVWSRPSPRIRTRPFPTFPPLLTLERC